MHEPTQTQTRTSKDPHRSSLVIIQSTSLTRGTSRGNNSGESTPRRTSEDTSTHSAARFFSKKSNRVKKYTMKGVMWGARLGMPAGGMIGASIGMSGGDKVSTYLFGFSGAFLFALIGAAIGCVIDLVKDKLRKRESDCDTRIENREAIKDARSHPHLHHLDNAVPIGVGISIGSMYGTMGRSGDGGESMNMPDMQVDESDLDIALDGVEGASEGALIGLIILLAVRGSSQFFNESETIVSSDRSMNLERKKKKEAKEEILKERDPKKRANAVMKAWEEEEARKTAREKLREEGWEREGELMTSRMVCW